MNSDSISADATIGWLSGARQVPSPNCDDRPSGTTVDLLVIHGISLPPGQYGGDAVERLFTNTLDCAAHPDYAPLRDLRVSAHILIRRDGELIQFVPLHRRAWHAGESSFEGRARCNDYSIGIELEGCDEEPYEAAQMEVLVSVIQALMCVYPKLNAQRIVGHCDIAPGRKTDPGPAFDWAALRRQLESD